MIDLAKEYLAACATALEDYKAQVASAHEKLGQALGVAEAEFMASGEARAAAAELMVGNTFKQFIGQVPKPPEINAAPVPEALRRVPRYGAEADMGVEEKG